jgi:hypothetical protein
MFAFYIEVRFFRNKTPNTPVPVSKSEVGSGTVDWTVAVPVKVVSAPSITPTPGSGKKNVPMP